jgi:hypothetical protein
MAMFYKQSKKKNTSIIRKGLDHRYIDTGGTLYGTLYGKIDLNRVL